MNTDDFKEYAKNEKELKTLIQTVGKHSQGIRMEFVIKKCAMLVIKSGKKETRNGIELPNQKRIRTLREKKNCKYLGIFEAIASNKRK